MKKIAVIVFCVVLLSGCAARQSIMRTGYAQEGGAAAVPVSNIPERSAEGHNITGTTIKAQEAAQSDRMMVKRAGISLAVDDPKKAETTAISIVKDAGGYVLNEQQYDDRYYLSIKVPPEKLESTVEKISSVIGGVESMNVSKEDVTAQVMDTEAVIKNKKALRDRLRQLADHASGIRDIMDIEAELARVQAEIDSMESWLKNLKGQAQMSEINLDIKQKVFLGPLGWLFMGIGYAIKFLFVWKI
jgi:hypothetical protein